MTTVGQALSVKEAKAQTQELLQDVEVGDQSSEAGSSILMMGVDFGVSSAALAVG